MSLEGLKKSIEQGVTLKQQRILNRIPSEKYAGVHGNDGDQPMSEEEKWRLKLEEAIRNLIRKGELPASTTSVPLGINVKVIVGTTKIYKEGERPVVSIKGKRAKQTHRILAEAMLPKYNMILTLQNRKTDTITRRKILK